MIDKAADLVGGDAAADDGGVPVRSLDDLLGSEPVALVSVDVEGEELAVLRGARRLLEQSKPLLVVELYLTRRDETPVLSFLEDAGYRAFVIDEVCGFNADCRNGLFVHASPRRALFLSRTCWTSRPRAGVCCTSTRRRCRRCAARYAPTR